MSSSLRRSVQFCIRLATLLAFTVTVALASTIIDPAGTGTLTFTQTITIVQVHCVTGGYANKTTYKDTGFSYKDANGAVTTLSGTGNFIENDCYGSGIGGVATLKSTQLDVVFDTTTSSDGVVTGFHPHGYINPKYVILGVTYAPPGPSSFVNYASSTTLSSTIDTKSTFSSMYQQSIKTTIGATFLGWSAGTSSTSTTAYTQASFTSSSDTISKSTSLSDQTPGPSNPYVGLNHDYDIIWLWLNPVQLFTLYENTAYTITSVEWDGYGFSTLDQPNMEVYPVYVGWLNGDIAMTTDQAKPLLRAWAAVETWPSGQGPALTSTGTSNDYLAIVQSDPYWQCTKLPSACPTTVDGTRFTQTPLNQNLVYLQAPVGGQPITQTYTDTYTQSSTQGTGASYVYAQTFAWETTFGGGGSIGSNFKYSFGTTESQSNTVTWTNMWDRYLTSSNTQTATASITGPPCVVSGSTCNPVYTKSTEFGLYEDNLYGTFFFFPLN